jgi:hypothetical protein
MKTIQGYANKIPYLEKQPLPISGAFCPRDRDEMIVVQTSLIDRGYWWSISNNRIKHIDAKILFWYEDGNITYSDSIERWKLEAEDSLNFHDYFEPVAGYEGYHTGKLYGI